MYRSILVPLDGSSFSEHALPVAYTIARASGATVHLAQVHVPSVKQYLASAPSIDAGLDAENRKRERAYLEAIPARMGAEADLKLVPVVLDGPVAQALAAYVSTNEIDLVIMTTHGRGGFTRLWVGSVAYTLAHHITVPLLLIRPAETAPDLAERRTLHHFLVPLDGSPLAEQVLEPTLELGKLMQADCTLLHVVEPLQLIGYSPTATAINLEANVTDSLRRDAEQYLGTVAQRLQADSVPVHTKVVIDGQPAAGIVRAAGESGGDMIAMATHGRGGLAGMLIGSVTDKVVRSAEMPVLVYRPKEHEAR
jgi:nucleotide-binding universal stress UspA family protein